MKELLMAIIAVILFTLCAEIAKIEIVLEDIAKAKCRYEERNP